jgi:uncharacterized protein YjiS (DUF1127 family)
MDRRRIMAIFTTFFAGIARSRARRAAIHELRQFPAHQLADIGIFPGQIEDAVDGMLQRSEKTGQLSRVHNDRNGGVLLPLFADGVRAA